MFIIQKTQKQIKKRRKKSQKCQKSKLKFRKNKTIIYLILKSNKETTKNTKTCLVHMKIQKNKP